MDDIFGKEEEEEDYDGDDEIEGKTEKERVKVKTKKNKEVEAVVQMTLKTVKKYQNRLLIGLSLCILYQLIYTILIFKKHSVYGYDLISYQFCIWSFIYLIVNIISYIYIIKYERKMLCKNRDDISLFFSILPLFMILSLIIINTIPLSFHYTETFKKCCIDSEISLNVFIYY